MPSDSVDDPPGLNLGLFIGLSENVLRIDTWEMALISRNSLLNEPLGQILNRLLLRAALPPEQVSNISPNFQSVLETPDPLHGLVLHKLRVNKILFIRAHKLLVVVPPSHLNIIGYLAKGFPVKILWLNLWDVPGVARYMSIPAVRDALAVRASLVPGNVASVPWDDFFCFLLSNHFKFLIFKEFIMGKMPCKFFAQGHCKNGDQCVFSHNADAQ